MSEGDYGRNQWRKIDFFKFEKFWELWLYKGTWKASGGIRELVIL